MKRAQTISVDFTLGLVALFFALMFVYIQFSSGTNAYMHRQTSTELQLLATSISENLVTTQGEPYTWDKVNPSQVDSVGLLNGNTLSHDKISALASYSQQELHNITGILGPSYTLGIHIEEFNGTNFTLVESIGILPNKTTSIVAMRDRFGTLTNITRIRVYVHKP